MNGGDLYIWKHGETCGNFENSEQNKYRECNDVETHYENCYTPPNTKVYDMSATESEQS